MNRKAAFLLLAASFLQAVVAHGESVKDALNHKYKKQVLGLRSPFPHGDLRFDSAGQALHERPAGSWLVYGGIYVEKLSLSSDTLRLEGPRGVLSQSNKERKPVLIRMGKSLKVEIHLDQPLKSFEEAQAVLGRVFFLDADASEHAKPEFRRADDSTSGEQIYHGGKDGTKFPKVLFTPEPEFSEEARKAKFQGNVVLNLVVEKAGNVDRIKIEKAAGMGLDENAVERVKGWSFEPATRNGQPVAAEMN